MKPRISGLLLNRWAAVLHDLLMIPVAWLFSYWLRFNLSNISPEYIDAAFYYLVVIIPIQATAFWIFGLYRGVWRFASIPDLLRIFKSVIVGIAITVMAIFLLYRMEGLPRSVPIFYGMLLIFLLGGPRFLYRWIKDHHLSIRSGKRVLIVGAGRAGEMLVRDLLRNSGDTYLPVAFVDDKVRRIGQDIHGIPVVGMTETLPEVVDKMGIEIIVLAIPSALVRERKKLIGLCEQAGVPFRTVPQLDSLMSGQVSINQLREVSIEDLLGREPVKLEWEVIKEGLSGRTILITGAGGSIGSELCRQLARLEPRKIILLEISEYNLYSIELELRDAFPDLLVYPCLADIREVDAVDKIFEKYKPSLIFHAAAYKHVPMLESHIREAIHNNVLGTRVVADAADKHSATKFVLISTDKAVNPTNIMGSTKRVAELYCQSLNASSATNYVTVRFGNVLGSAGSVVPLFRKQIMQGGPVTVTHPDIERFFMTIPEACQLIMQASVLGDGGEIFVLDMGEPVKIHYLAEQMILLSGRQPGEDIEISITGLRPGEKLFEELFHNQEKLQPTHHKKILLADHRLAEWGELSEVINKMSESVSSFDEQALIKLLRHLVPEGSIDEAPSRGDDSTQSNVIRFKAIDRT